MTEDIKMLREALEMAAEHYEPMGTRRAEELLAALDRVVAERDRSQRNHEDACQCIAEMHAAAIGRWGGPVGRGVVEDVAALRTALQTIRDATYDTETAEHELLRGEVRHTAEDALALSSATPPPAPCVPAETLEEMLRVLFNLRDPRWTQAAQDAAYRGKAALDILTRRLAEATSERDGLRLASGPGHSCAMLAARLNHAEAERDNLRGQLEAHSDAKRCEEATARLLADYDVVRAENTRLAEQWRQAADTNDALLSERASLKAALKQAESALFLLTVADTEHNRKLRDEALKAVTRALGDEGACRGWAR